MLSSKETEFQNVHVCAYDESHDGPDVPADGPSVVVHAVCDGDIRGA